MGKGVRTRKGLELEKSSEVQLHVVGKHHHKEAEQHFKNHDSDTLRWKEIQVLEKESKLICNNRVQ
jgi:hypothetical protein